jgi:hypothetical protein
MPGPKPRGDHALTAAERAAAYRERLKAGDRVVIRYRKPADRRSRPKRWNDAIEALHACLNDWEAAREALPPSLTDGAYGAKLDAVIELRELVEQLDAADVPLGFGRD